MYVVRSSAASEDSVNATAAGKYETIIGVGVDSITDAVKKVQSGFDLGKVIIQEDLTERMLHSGVAYTDINGRMEISMGPKDSVHGIVKGEAPATHIRVESGGIKIEGNAVDPSIINMIKEESIRAEKYFGRPLDIEFAFTESGFVFLQARPLPSLTDSAVREFEIRSAESMLENAKALGVSDMPLGVGNYREILADSKATQLGSSTFNHIFTGDGKNILGAMQLGRNELGYDNGYEVFPQVLMLGGKVYYNFIGDSMQFRPSGIELTAYVKAAERFYIKEVKENPDRLNYPELGLYIQFPDEAKKAGLEEGPFERLVERNRQEIRKIKIPDKAPKKILANLTADISECIREIAKNADRIRTGSAKEYVKAARLAFFAMEDVKHALVKLKEDNPGYYAELAKEFYSEDPEKLRNSIIYDESIRSFELDNKEENRYIGSFELSLERDFPPRRNYKEGRPIKDGALREAVDMARLALENREKVKFYLFRDYDVLYQLYAHLRKISEFGDNIFRLKFEELDLLVEETPRAEYRISLRRDIESRTAALFPDPLFMGTARIKNDGVSKEKVEMVFGRLHDGEHIFRLGSSMKMLKEVDQTISIGDNIEVLVVQDNIKPGSHIFTQLSDYNIPVISLSGGLFGQIEKSGILKLKKTGDIVEIIRD